MKKMNWFCLMGLALSWLFAQNTLEVKETEKHLFASRLQGEWKLEKTLTERFTPRKYSLESIRFEPDSSVLQTIPPKYEELLQGKVIYLAGLLGVKQKTVPFLLTEKEGSPYVIFFRERGGEPMGDTESFYLSLIPAKDPKKDLLFIGGDFPNDPFCVFERASIDVGTDPSFLIEEAKVCISEMIALIESGKDLEFLETYADPQEIQKFKIAKVFEKVLADFKASKNKELLEILKKLNSIVPEIDESKEVLTYKHADFSKALRLKKINGRWYLLN